MCRCVGSQLHTHTYTPTHLHTHTQRSSEAEQQAPQKNGVTGVTASDGSRARARRALIALVGDRLASYSSSRQQDEALLAGATRSPLRMRYACATHTLRIRYSSSRQQDEALLAGARCSPHAILFFFFNCCVSECSYCWSRELVCLMIFPPGERKYTHLLPRGP